MFEKFVRISLCILSCTSLIFALNCTNDLDCQTKFKDPPYVECVSGRCKCMEFFTLDRVYDDKCVKGASLGKECRQGAECQIILGESSRCFPPSGGVCGCYSSSGGENASMAHYQGKCYELKGFGEPCTQDYQCMLDVNGTVFNPLGRCIDKICACYNDDSISSMPMHGMCMVHCPDCKIVNISILIVTLGGALGILLFVYVMYRVATEDKPSEKEIITQDKSHNNSRANATTQP